jgi:hypothetical protein
VVVEDAAADVVAIVVVDTFDPEFPVWLRPDSVVAEAAAADVVVPFDPS